MSNENELKKAFNPIKSFMEGQGVKQKFQELLGSKAQGFVTSVLQVCFSNELLKNADPQSVYQAAAIAATLDLPINNNLGFAYIVPYRDREKGQIAQFQMGYKGFIQLAQRSGQFKTISASPIYEGQLIEENPLKGYLFDFINKKSDKVIGFAAYFSLINGFEKTLYMTTEELDKHGVKYSQTAKKGFGLWKDDFNAMAQKTVIKLLLSKFAPLSIEMQKATIADQAVIKDVDTMDVEYIDNADIEIVIEDIEMLFDMKKSALSKEDLANAERIINNKEVKSYNKLHSQLSSL